MKTYWGSGSIPPRILGLDIQTSDVDSVLVPYGKNLVTISCPIMSASIHILVVFKNKTSAWIPLAWFCSIPQYLFEVWNVTPYRQANLNRHTHTNRYIVLSHLGRVHNNGYKNKTQSRCGPSHRGYYMMTYTSHHVLDCETNIEFSVFVNYNSCSLPHPFH
jgi:hypothetical protein